MPAKFTSTPTVIHPRSSDALRICSSTCTAARSLIWIVASCFLFGMTACGKDNPTGPTGPDRVVVSPASAKLTAIGQTVQIDAQLQDGNGQTLTGADFTWSSTNPGVATVSSGGIVTAVRNGTAEIRATTGQKQAVAAITVAQAAGSIVVTPAIVTFTD